MFGCLNNTGKIWLNARFMLSLAIHNVPYENIGLKVKEVYLL